MSTPKSIFHAAALQYAAQGIPVFPCVPGGKAPATANGYKDASTDPAVIDAWFNENESYNIGMCPASCTPPRLVVDVEGTALDDWAMFKEPTPETLIIGTPNGGLHLHFEGEGPSTVRRLMGKEVGIDTRGYGGYVLMPPSLVMAKDGSGLKPYTVLEEKHVARLPEWITRGIATTANRVESSGAEVDSEGDRRRAVSHLLDLVRRGDVSVSGQGGNNTAYRVSAAILELGVSADTALVLLEEHWNPACQPPWSHGELATIVRNAAEYQQNDVGAYATRPAAETFASAWDNLPAELKKAPPRSRFYPENDAEMDQTRPQDWVFPELLPDRTVAMLYGPSGSYKSFLLIALALAKATGKPSLGFDAFARGPVFYAAGEGRDDVKLRRRNAWKKAHDVSGETGFYVMPTPRISVNEEMQEFGDQIKMVLDRDGFKKPGVIMLETVSKMMVGLDPTRDAPKLTRFCESLAEAFECPVIVVHHTGHDKKRGPRDSSAYEADFDVILRVDGIKATKCSTLVVEKMKGAAEREEPMHFQGEVVQFKHPISGASDGSLVFHRITANDFELLNPNEGEEPKVGKAAVAAALSKLEAWGVEKSVSQRVLATEVAMALELVQESKSADANAEVVANVDRLLGRLAATRPLRPYNEKRNGTRIWYLPGAAPEQAPNLKA